MRFPFVLILAIHRGKFTETHSQFWKKSYEVHFILAWIREKVQLFLTQVFSKNLLFFTIFGLEIHKSWRNFGEKWWSYFQCSEFWLSVQNSLTQPEFWHSEFWLSAQNPLHSLNFHTQNFGYQNFLSMISSKNDKMHSQCEVPTVKMAIFLINSLETKTRLSSISNL